MTLLTTIDYNITTHCISLLNRIDPDMLQYMEYHIYKCDPSEGETLKPAKEFGQQLIDNIHEVIEKSSLYKDSEFYILILFL